jgi:hypothetical protein
MTTLSIKQFRELKDKGIIKTTNKGFYGNVPDNTKRDNRRVKGANRCTHEGITFDSELERDFYIALKRYNIPFELKRKFDIIRSFQYNGNTVRGITWTPDFFFQKINLIVDTKGYSTDIFELKLKFFKYVYQNFHFVIWRVKTKKDIFEAVNLILSFHSGTTLTKIEKYLL